MTRLGFFALAFFVACACGLPAAPRAPAMPDPFTDVPRAVRTVEGETEWTAPCKTSQGWAYCALGEAHDTARGPGPWSCTARSVLGHAYVSLGETREEARAYALNSCQEHHPICYVSRCASEADGS